MDIPLRHMPSLSEMTSKVIYHLPLCQKNLSRSCYVLLGFHRITRVYRWRVLYHTALYIRFTQRTAAAQRFLYRLLEGLYCPAHLLSFLLNRVLLSVFLDLFKDYFVTVQTLFMKSLDTKQEEIQMRKQHQRP
jgi:hypothetical protein